MIPQPAAAQYLTTRMVAVAIGRTDSRVRQYVRGECGCEPLPAERAVSSGCAGMGLLLTSVESFSAWCDAWRQYPRRW